MLAAAKGQPQSFVILAPDWRVPAISGRSRSINGYMLAPKLTGIMPAAGRRTGDKAMEKVLPVLHIDDYEVALDFYISCLGFEVLMEHRHEPGFPVFMIVRKGGLELGLSEHGRGNQGTEVYLYVDDLEAWHKRCVSNEIARESSPTAMPWGNTEMLIKDPFRNALRFAQQGTHEGTNTPNK